MKNHIFSTVVTIILAGFPFSSQAANTKSIHSLPPIPCPTCGFRNLGLTKSETPKLNWKIFWLDDMNFIEIDLIDFLNLEYENECREPNNSNLSEPSPVLNNQINNNGRLERSGGYVRPINRPVPTVGGGTRPGFSMPDCRRDDGRNNNRILPPVESQAAPIPRVGGGTR